MCDIILSTEPSGISMMTWLAVVVPGCSWQGELLVLTRWNIQLHNSGTKREKDTQSKLCVINSCVTKNLLRQILHVQ